VAHQVLADRTIAGKHTHHSVGQVRFGEHLGEKQSVQRGFGRGFENHGAAGE
jgi:hypothetical protein